MANHNCKCGDNCTCDPCNCDKIEEFDNIPPVTVIGHKGGFTGGWAHWDLSGHGDNGWQGVPYAYPPKPKCKKRSNQIRPGLPTLKLTAQDIQDIIKVTSTEVDLRGGDVARQTAGVVDTILNRASLKKYGGNIRNVINENSQFSKISGAPGAYGSVQAVPDKVINAQVKAEVLNHLQNRANGTESTVGGHTHYLNPKVSGKKSLNTWGNAVVESTKKSGLVFGKPPFAHYHGTPPKEKPAGKFNVNIPASFFDDTCTD